MGRILEAGKRFLPPRGCESTEDLAEAVCRQGGAKEIRIKKAVLEHPTDVNRNGYPASPTEIICFRRIKIKPKNGRPLQIRGNYKEPIDTRIKLAEQKTTAERRLNCTVGMEIDALASSDPNKPLPKIRTSRMPGRSLAKLMEIDKDKRDPRYAPLLLNNGDIFTTSPQPAK
ncbi:hypothetical protein KKG52_03900 [Patescibacteria group bacterium]|nr:hypothetical protein [Patescibacteria group bacterium]